MDRRHLLFQVPRRETWFLFIYRLDRWARGRLKEEKAKEESAENYEFRYVPTNLLGDDGKLLRSQTQVLRAFRSGRGHLRRGRHAAAQGPCRQGATVCENPHEEAKDQLAPF